MSNKSSAQLYVTSDVCDKDVGIFTYVEILRNLFNISIISFGNCMHLMFVQFSSDKAFNTNYMYM